MNISNNDIILKFQNELVIPEISSKFKKEGYCSKTYIEEVYRVNMNLWNNMLIWGDNKDIMIALLKNYKEKIDLIYIDPPFFTENDYYKRVFLNKQYIQKISYYDKWNKDLDSYLAFLYERLIVMKNLLSKKGSIYVHIDWHVSHHVKLIMDKIFGTENFRNEIIWFYPAASSQTKRFYVRSYDSIFFYTKSEDYIFNDNPEIYMEYSNRVKNALKKDEKGYYYHRGGSHDGKKLKKKVYTEKKGVFPRDVWMDIPYIRANTPEYQGFSTQKPERLLKRIIIASSNKDSIVADFFCGSGSTVAVAEKLGRKWIGCDQNKEAIFTSWKRLLELNNSNDILNWKNKYNSIVRPFKIYNTEIQDRKRVFPNNFLKSDEKIQLENLKEPKIEIKLERENNKIKIEISNYIASYLNLLNNEIRTSIKDWYDLIDCILIDFNYNREIFRPIWISYKTPKNRELLLRTGEFEYDEKKSFNIMIKVIDIIGFEVIKNIAICT